jgi:hypothetical protein
MTNSTPYLADETELTDQTTAPGINQLNPIVPFEPAFEARVRQQQADLSSFDPAMSEPSGIQCLCPFCGAFNSDVSRPCATCRREDTVAMRDSLRQAVGPWFVLHPEEPAAPGMSFEELQERVRRQAITSRSVVRGPTTGQLWRLAARVPGLSREFGICYACGGDVQPGDTRCPHCDRNQITADAAGDVPQTSPVTEAVEQNNQVLRGTADGLDELWGSRPANAAHPAAAPVPETSVPDTTAATPPGNQITSKVQEPTIHVHTRSDRHDDDIVQRPVIAEQSERHIPKDDLLTPADLAKAFLLEFDAPSAKPDLSAHRLYGKLRRSSRQLKLVLAGTAAMVVFTALLWPVTQWIRGSSTPTGSPHSFTTPVDTVAIASNPINPDVRIEPQTPAAPTADDVPTSPASPAPVTAAPAAASATVAPAESSAQLASSNSFAEPLIVPETTPTAASDDPAELWTAALNAESAGNFAAAVQAYERIESLPSYNWPATLQSRLAAARKQLKEHAR